MDKEASCIYFEKIGRDLLGTEADRLDSKVIQVAGLLGVMGKTYANEKKLKAHRVSIEYQNLIIKFVDKKNNIIDHLTVTREDIANPGKWHDRLLGV